MASHHSTGTGSDRGSTAFLENSARAGRVGLVSGRLCGRPCAHEPALPSRKVARGRLAVGDAAGSWRETAGRRLCGTFRRGARNCPCQPQTGTTVPFAHATDGWLVGRVGIGKAGTATRP